VSSQNILIEIYPIFQLSKDLESTEGILILSLITSFSNTSFSQDLIISNKTFVQAGHFILSTASYNHNHSNDSQLALIIISLAFNQYFFAGDHLIILSIDTHNSFLSTTAHIHSKSQDNISLNFLVSFVLKNSLCLSHNHSTNHLIAESTNSFLSIQLEL